jgi:hypothetical protein
MVGIQYSTQYFLQNMDKIIHNSFELILQNKLLYHSFHYKRNHSLLKIFIINFVYF